MSILTNEDTETERLRNVPKVTQLVSDTAKDLTQVYAWTLNLFAINHPNIYRIYDYELIFKSSGFSSFSSFHVQFLFIYL